MNATADRCQEKAGFLFSHACSRAQEASCDDCGKQTCEKHSRTEDDHTRCITCAKKTLKLGGRPTKSKSRQRQRYRDDYYYDPYFYGPCYYDGYGYYGSGYWGHDHSYHGHDHDDFTEADGENMLSAEAEDFEHDAAAS